MNDSDFKQFELTVENDGRRIDRFVADALLDLSRSAVQRLLEQGEILVNDDVVTRASHKIQRGDVVLIRIPSPKPVALEPEILPLDIIYEDGDILVLNKAPGMVVHPGAGNPSGTVVNAVLAHCPDLTGVGGELRPGIVHRLDKDTSGVLIIAKHDRAIRVLQRQFKRRTVRKRYIALVVGDLSQAEGIIDAPIGRHARHRKKMAVSASGKPARTRWRVLARYRDTKRRPYTSLEIDLLTGRTHQIRVHFSWLGYPLVGDEVYGSSNALLAAPRQFLHAQTLMLTHPTTGEEMTFSTPLPSDLEAVLSMLDSGEL